MVRVRMSDHDRLRVQRVPALLPALAAIDHHAPAQVLDQQGRVITMPPGAGAYVAPCTEESQFHETPRRRTALSPSPAIAPALLQAARARPGWSRPRRRIRPAPQIRRSRPVPFAPDRVPARRVQCAEGNPRDGDTFRGWSRAS